MIAYHWSPSDNRKSIQKHGLLIGQPSVVTSQGHRNPHLSASRSPMAAWSLSGGFLEGQLRRKRIEDMPRRWDLWQIDLANIKYQMIPNYIELQIKQDVPRKELHFVAVRIIG